MKKAAPKFIKVFSSVRNILIAAGVIGWSILIGSYVLNLFGILSYDPPINREAGDILKVQLVDTSEQYRSKVLAELTGESLEQFLGDFEEIRFKRYANDPPEPYGDLMIAIYYEDGSVDRIGDEMNQRFDSSGRPISSKGWYYCPDHKMDQLFEKYVYNH